jgi:hypothetical protein
LTRNNEHEDPQGAHDLEGRYANYFKAGYNAFEFLLDFGQCYAEDEEAQLHTRIITSPIYAKTLLEFLRECIDQYEHDFGVIACNSGDDNQHPK